MKDQVIQALQGSPSSYSRAVRELCEDKELQNAVVAMVKKLGGNLDNAEDVFWQGIEIVINNIRTAKFRGDSTIKTYLVAICKNIYLKYYKHPITVEEEALLKMESPNANPEVQQIENDRQKQLVVLYQQFLGKIGVKCKKIFEMLKRDASMQALMEELGYDKIQSARNEAYRCRKKARQIIQENEGLRRQILDLL